VEPKEGVAGRILNPELVLRLGVVIVNLPPLRNRKSDIALLCDHFIGKMNLKLGKNVTGLDDELKPAFNGHDWPGNVRELESAIEGAMNMIPENETVLRFQHFNATLLSVFLKGALARTDSDAKTPHFLNRPAEAERIAAALEAAGGNAAKAARSLKISPQLMNYKLKKFSLKKKITVHVE
jgi:arginine utilization regulatory protein